MLMVVREVREGAAVPEGGGDLRLQACEWATSRWRGFLAVGGEENPSQVPTFHTNTKNSPPLWRLVRVVRAAGWHLMEPGEWRIRVLSSCGAAEQQSAEQPTVDCRQLEEEMEEREGAVSHLLFVVSLFVLGP